MCARRRARWPRGGHGGAEAAVGGSPPGPFPTVCASVGPAPPAGPGRVVRNGKGPRVRGVSGGGGRAGRTPRGVPKRQGKFPRSAPAPSGVFGSPPPSPSPPSTRQGKRWLRVPPRPALGAAASRPRASPGSPWRSLPRPLLFPGAKLLWPEDETSIKAAPALLGTSSSMSVRPSVCPRAALDPTGKGNGEVSEPVPG